MDQDPFNDVFDEEIRYLPPVWNLMSYNLWLNPYTRYSIDQINFFYSTEYATVEELESDAAIIHLTNEFKPWEYENSYMFDQWMDVFHRSRFADITLHLKQIPDTDIAAGKNGTVHMLKRMGPFVKDWSEQLTVLRLFGIPIVKKIKGGWYTSFKIFGIPVIKREWQQFEERTLFLYVCIKRRPHWPEIKRRVDELFGSSGPILDLMLPAAGQERPDDKKEIKQQLDRLEKLGCICGKLGLEGN